MRSLRKLDPVGGLYRSLRYFVRRNRGRSLRQKIFSLLHPTPTSGSLHRIIDAVIIACVLTSVICIGLETVPEVHAAFGHLFHMLEILTVGIFTLEYLGRVYCICEIPAYAHPVRGRLRYMLTASALIDLLAIMPFYVGLLLHEVFDLRFLRVFRLSRLLKLTRYTGTLSTLYKALERERRVLVASAFIMILLVVLTASLGYELEHAAQPDKFDTMGSSMYWAVITLASVGYGDIAPVTPLGKAITVVISFIGIGIFAVPAGLMASAFTDQLRIDRETFESEFRAALTDGRISSLDRAALQAEAERLHLSTQDVERIMRKVKHEVRGEHEAGQKQSPEQMLERFRQQLSQLRGIALSSEAARIESLLTTPDASTGIERRVWALLRANHRQAEAPDDPPSPPS